MRRAHVTQHRSAGVSKALALGFALAAVFGCGGDPAEPALPELVIYAAASTRDALLELEPWLEAEHGVDLVFNFGSSGALANQVLAAGLADLFLSASARDMDRVAEAGLLAPGSRVDLLSNQLAVIEPREPRTPLARPFSAASLLAADVRRVSLAEVETVPAGRYAKAWLDALGIYDALRERVIPAVDVRAALAAVESGACDAGIVYRSDAVASSAVTVVFTVPIEEGPRIVYPVAALADRPALERSRAILVALTAPKAREAFDRAGFLVLPPPGAR